MVFKIRPNTKTEYRVYSSIFCQKSFFNLLANINFFAVEAWRHVHASKFSEEKRKHQYELSA